MRDRRRKEKREGRVCEIVPEIFRETFRSSIVCFVSFMMMMIDVDEENNRVRHCAQCWEYNGKQHI